MKLVRRSAFDRIFEEMKQIRFRLDDIEATVSGWSPKPLEISDQELFLLPDHLRKTYLTVMSKGKTSATETANLTGRCRAMESNYLNQLSRMGWLTKHRDSKTVRFSLISKEMLKERLQKQ
jgi:hypothetical protein